MTCTGIKVKIKVCTEMMLNELLHLPRAKAHKKKHGVVNRAFILCFKIIPHHPRRHTAPPILIAFEMRDVDNAVLVHIFGDYSMLCVSMKLIYLCVRNDIGDDYGSCQSK